MNYLSQARNKRAEYLKTTAGGSSMDGYEQDQSASNDQKKKTVADKSLNKILQDQNISEYERMQAIRLRADQIEQKALMEE